MNLFSDNKRILKNNFKSIIFPSTVVVVVTTPVHLPLPLSESVELYDEYILQDIIDETNPMIKTKPQINK